MSDLVRASFFDGQPACAEDFGAAQAFVIAKRRLRNRFLRTWGIVRGLDVEPGIDLRSIVVNEGLAFDRQGRELTVSTRVAIDLSSKPAGEYAVVLVYAEQPAAPSEGAQPLPRRILEGADVAVLTVGTDGGDCILLARVAIDGRGLLALIDPRARRHVGVRVGALTFASAVAAGEATDGNMSGSARADIADSGRLRVRAPSTSFSGSLRIAGSLRVARASVPASGADEPPPALDVRASAPGGAPLLRVSRAAGDASGVDDTLLSILESGAVGIGVAAPGARLDVRGGDILLDADREIVVHGEASIARADGAQSLAFEAERVSFVDPAAILVTTGAEGARPTLAVRGDALFLAMAPDGATPAGPNAPAKLTVGGPVQATAGGFRFKVGGVLQTTAALFSTVRVGTVLDWWPPPGSSGKPPPEFAVCDGSFRSPLDDTPVPNLDGRFVRGAVDAGHIGEVGGTDKHQHSITSFGAHRHAIDHHHGHFWAMSGTPIGDAGSEAVDVKLSSVDHQHVIDADLAACPEHVSSTDDGSTPGLVVDPASTLPLHTRVLKIMRIR